MKVLYLTLENVSLHKGSVIHIKEIVKGFRSLGHEVGLAARSLEPFKNADNFYNLSLLLQGRSRGLAPKEVAYFIASIRLFLGVFKVLHRYDIVYARDYHATLIAFLPCFIFKKKLVFEINGLANEEQRLKSNSMVNRILVFLIRWAETAAARGADRIISVTPQIARYLCHKLHCREDKIEIVGNGVDTERFRPIRDEVLLSQYREKERIEPEEKVLVFVGNLARWQGIEVLIDCAGELLLKNKNLKFLIVGDGPLREELLRKAQKTGVGKFFVFTGMVDYNEIPFYINLAHIGVAPFVSDRNEKTGVSPLKVFEYMACGKPIVASKIEGLEFIEKEGIGMLVESAAAKCLARALGDLLQDDENMVEMGKKGVLIADERFSWVSKAKKIAGILQKMA